MPAQTRTTRPIPQVPLQLFPARTSTAEADSSHGLSKLSRPVVNFWLDTLLLVVFLLLSITAVIVQFVFPPPSATAGWMLWGLSFNAWCSLQFGLIAVLALGILVHLMLHWSWICTIIARRLLKQTSLPDTGLQTLYGVGFLITVLLTAAGLIGLATMTIRMPDLP